MGYYVNVPETKEEWLEENGVLDGMQWPKTSFNDAAKNKEALVCLVDNGRFTAAGIAFSSDEYDAFNDILDTRPKVWYRVPAAKLVPFCSYMSKLL